MPLRRKTIQQKPVHLAVETDVSTPDFAILHLEGCWRKDNRPPRPEHAALPKEIRRLAFNCTKLTEWDSGLLAFLYKLAGQARENGIELDFNGLPEGARRLLTLAQAVPLHDNALSRKNDGWLHEIGQKTLEILSTAAGINRFVGELTEGVIKFFVGMSQARWINVWEQIAKAGYQAMPLISMIGFLIGLILAFIGCIPLKMFGADIFVASLVGIGVLRLMSPVMVGTVMAGRTGASFAAELGSMNANDEIDAFRAMGVSPMEFLVLPRFIALCVMVPLLCLYSDLLGILGGMTVGLFYSNLTYLEFYKQMTSTTTINDLRIYNARIGQADGNCVKTLTGNMTVFGTPTAPSTLEGSGDNGNRILDLNAAVKGAEGTCLRVVHTTAADKKDCEFFVRIPRSNASTFQGTFEVEGVNVNVVAGDMNVFGSTYSVTLRNGGGLLGQGSTGMAVNGRTVTIDNGGRMGAFQKNGTSITFGGGSTITGTGKLLIYNPRMGSVWKGPIAMNDVTVSGLDGIVVSNDSVLAVGTGYKGAAIPIAVKAGGKLRGDGVAQTGAVTLDEGAILDFTLSPGVLTINGTLATTAADGKIHTTFTQSSRHRSAHPALLPVLLPIHRKNSQQELSLRLLQ